MIYTKKMFSFYRKLLPIINRIVQKIFSKKIPVFLLYFFGGIILISLALSPIVNYKIGGLFFGQVPKLYNVNLAQFFFTQAANPIIGTTPQYSNYQLARTYFIQGKLQETLTEAYKEIELYPTSTKTYYMLGLTYGYMGQERKAIEMFSIYIDKVPTSWAARNDKAWLQFRIGDIDGALVTLEPVTHLTNVIWVQNSYGVMLLNKGRYPEAKKAFTYAEKIAETMTPESWGIAYPGNDPRIYTTGLQAMKTSIENNLEIIKNIETKKKLQK